MRRAVRLWSSKCEEVIGLHSFLFLKCDTSSLFPTRFANAVYFGSFLFARYAISSQSVFSGRTRSEISVKMLITCIYICDAEPGFVARCIDLITDDIFIFVRPRQRLLYLYFEKAKS